MAKIHIKPDHIPVLPNIIIYRRINIGNEIFVSTFSKRHKTLAKILIKFILDDNSADIFSGLIQYYFKHEVQLPEGPKKHILAFVCWYKADNSNKDSIIK